VSAKKSPPSDFRTILERLARGNDTHRVFSAFVRFAACALAAQTREAEYLEEAKHWQRPELELFAEALGALVREMESKPFEDIIGGYYMEVALSSKGQQWNGEYALRPQAPEAAEQGQPPKPIEVERITASLGQQEFAL
jgi:hypothetical protein